MYSPHIELSVDMYICAPHAYLVSSRVGRGYFFSFELQMSMKIMWLLRAELRSSERAVSPLKGRAISLGFLLLCLLWYNFNKLLVFILLDSTFTNLFPTDFLIY